MSVAIFPTDQTVSVVNYVACSRHYQDWVRTFGLVPITCKVYFHAEFYTILGAGIGNKAVHSGSFEVLYYLLSWLTMGNMGVCS